MLSPPKMEMAQQNIFLEIGFDPFGNVIKHWLSFHSKLKGKRLMGKNTIVKSFAYHTAVSITSFGLAESRQTYREFLICIQMHNLGVFVIFTLIINK